MIWFSVFNLFLYYIIVLTPFLTPRHVVEEHSGDLLTSRVRPRTNSFQQQGEETRWTRSSPVEVFINDHAWQALCRHGLSLACTRRGNQHQGSSSAPTYGEHTPLPDSPPLRSLTHPPSSALHHIDQHTEKYKCPTLADLYFIAGVMFWRSGKWKLFFRRVFSHMWDLFLCLLFLYVLVNLEVPTIQTIVLPVLFSLYCVHRSSSLLLLRGRLGLNAPREMYSNRLNRLSFSMCF